jgi:hypothetical protein
LKINLNVIIVFDVNRRQKRQVATLKETLQIEQLSRKQKVRIDRVTNRCAQYTQHVFIVQGRGNARTSSRS